MIETALKWGCFIWKMEQRKFAPQYRRRKHSRCKTKARWGKGAKMEQDLFGTCPYATTQRLIQGKWAILLLHELSGEPVRFNELQRRMPKMTHATLSNQLKQLEAEGLIRRVVHHDIPPKVEYSLTDMGRKFSPVLDSIKAFGEEYMTYMKERKQQDKS